MIIGYIYQHTAINLDSCQPQKTEIKPFLGSQPRSILAIQDQCINSVATCMLPKRLGPQVKVNQRGQLVLQWGGMPYLKLHAAVHMIDGRADEMTGYVQVP